MSGFWVKNKTSAFELLEVYETFSGLFFFCLVCPVGVWLVSRRAVCADIPYAQCLALGQIARAEGADASEVAFEGMPHNVFFEDAKPEECSRAICGFVAEC